MSDVDLSPRPGLGRQAAVEVLWFGRLCDGTDAAKQKVASRFMD